MENKVKKNQNKYQISYWIYSIIFWIIGVLLAIFIQDLLLGWGNPRAITTFTHIKNRLGEVVAFGMSVVILLYSTVATSLLIFGIFKPGLSKFNYKFYSKMHSLIFFSVN